MMNKIRNKDFSILLWMSKRCFSYYLLYYLYFKVKRFIRQWGKKTVFQNSQREWKTFARDSILSVEAKNGFYTKWEDEENAQHSIEVEANMCNLLRQCSLSIWFRSEISQHSANSVAFFSSLSFIFWGVCWFVFSTQFFHFIFSELEREQNIHFDFDALCLKSIPWKALVSRKRKKSDRDQKKKLVDEVESKLEHVSSFNTPNAFMRVGFVV